MLTVSVKAIIFDIDDTLVQTLNRAIEAMKFTAKKYYDLDISTEHILNQWGLPFHEHMRKVFMDADDVENLRQNYFEERENFKLDAHEGAIDLINILSKKYLVCALTSSPRIIIEKDLTITGFDISKFYYIQTEDDTDVHKPDPKVFLPLIEKLKEKGIGVEKMLYIGDNINDYFAANKAGLNFIGVLTGTTTKEEFVGAGLDQNLIAREVREIVGVLDDK